MYYQQRASWENTNQIAWYHNARAENIAVCGEKNLHGRVVYYSRIAEQALNRWLAIRETMSDYLFFGYAGQELSYVGAWMIMQKAIEKSGLGHKGYPCTFFNNRPTTLVAKRLSFNFWVQRHCKSPS